MDQIFINYHAFKNRLLSLIKNLDSFNLVKILIPHLLIILGLGFYYLLKFEFNKSKMIFSAIAWNLVELPHTFRKRVLIQKQRKKSDAEIFKSIYKPTDFIQMFLHFQKVEANFK